MSYILSPIVACSHAFSPSETTAESLRVHYGWRTTCCDIERSLCRDMADSLRHLYEYFQQLYDNVRVSASFLRVRVRSAESPINGNGVAVKHSFSTHNYPGWISSAIHTVNNNLIHFLWIYINLNNHCSRDEEQSIFCVSRACTPTRDTLTPLSGEKYLSTRMKLALCRAKSNECRTISY